MNWVLRLAGIVLLTVGAVTFFFPSPYWYFSIISFLILLIIGVSSIVSNIAETASETVSGK